VSQILNGDRALQIEYAFGITQFVALPPNEADYFLLLVQAAQAGHESFRQHLKGKIQMLRRDSSDLKKRIGSDVELTEEVRAKFYSHWIYSAVRLLTDIELSNTPQAISAQLDLPLEKVASVLEFLVDSGLCAREGGHYKIAVQNTHLESESPWIYSRQLQWRQKAMQKMDMGMKEDLYYTGPMTLSEKDRQWVRDRLGKLIQEIAERVRGSKSEKLMCLNVDWFSLT
jgi:uncharacterized protein (TIGR02147 family)